MENCPEIICDLIISERPEKDFLFKTGFKCCECTVDETAVECTEYFWNCFFKSIPTSIDTCPEDSCYCSDVTPTIKKSTSETEIKTTKTAFAPPSFYGTTTQSSATNGTIANNGTIAQSLATNGVSTGALAGAIVGGILGLVLVAALIAVAVIAYRRRNRKPNNSIYSQYNKETSQHVYNNMGETNEINSNSVVYNNVNNNNNNNNNTNNIVRTAKIKTQNKEMASEGIFSIYDKAQDPNHHSAQNQDSNGAIVEGKVAGKHKARDEYNRVGSDKVDSGKIMGDIELYDNPNIVIKSQGFDIFDKNINLKSTDKEGSDKRAGDKKSSKKHADDKGTGDKVLGDMELYDNPHIVNKSQGFDVADKNNNSTSTDSSAVYKLDLTAMSEDTVLEEHDGYQSTQSQLK